MATSVTSPQDPSEDAKAKQLLAVSSQKRELAYKLGVDVYSSNSVLQEELNSVAWASALGGLTLTAALMPVGAPAAAVFKGMRAGDQLGQSLKDEPPARLRIINKEKLTAMGVPETLQEKFLDHPSFTPRHDTVIVESLARLQGAKGRDTFIQFALAANDEESANFFEDIAETMRGYHETVSPIKQIRISSGVVVAEAKNGSILIPFPLDHGVWTARAAGILNKIAAEHKASGSKGSIEVWVTGTLSSMAKEQLALLGINVAENVDNRIEFID